MTPIRVLLTASEMTPLAKVGGLADVVGTLPRYLNRLDCDARVILPLYQFIKEEYAEQLQFLRWSTIRMGWRRIYSGLFRMDLDGLTVYFIDNEYYFGHDTVYLDYSFDMERFSFYQRALLEAMGDPMEFEPDILLCNDWQAGMLPCLLDAHYRPQGYHCDVKTVFTIHNLKYQGIHGVEHIQDLMDLPDGYMTHDLVLKDGVPNFMKAGIVYADRITTVSPSYAQEILTPEFGEGMDGVLRHFSGKITGILNGIDTETFDPATDPLIAANFTADNWADGKSACRAAVRRELGLPDDPDAPLAVMISRLVDQKGLDLLIRALDAIADRGIQVVVQGTGDPYYEHQLREAAGRHPDVLKAVIAFDAELAHRLYAGADLFLMPSLFEPCGLSQMIAMRYGTVPVARETGGLKDTVRPYNKFTGEGNGFTFANADAVELLSAVLNAADIYCNHKDAWDGLVRSGMTGDYTWKKSADAYVRLFRDLVRR